jgi:hypothetical protein
LIELHIQHAQKSTNSAAAIQPQFGFLAIFSYGRKPASSPKRKNGRFRRRKQRDCRAEIRALARTVDCTETDPEDSEFRFLYSFRASEIFGRRERCESKAEIRAMARTVQNGT